MGVRLTELAAQLAKLPRRRRTLLIGIDGRGASGKSSLARALASQLGDSRVIELDDFYLPASDRRVRRERGDTEIGGDFDWRRARDQVLLPLSDDRPSRYQRYDWGTDRLAEWHDLALGGILIVEGNYSTRRGLREFYDFTIWVEAPPEVRLRRGLERDGEEARERWLSDWMPEEDRYVSAEHPEKHADLVLDGTRGL